MGFDPYRGSGETGGPTRFDIVVAAVVLLVIAGFVAWAVFF